MSKEVSSVIVSCLLLLTAGSSAFAQKTQNGDDFYGRKYALVIGNSKYETKPLVNPENDATDIAAVLSKTGFKVTTVLNVGKSELELAIAKFESSLPKRAAVLVFYAGHAVQYQAQNVLLPIDAIESVARPEDLFVRGVVLGDLFKQLGPRNDSVITVILDACRDSPFPNRPEFSGGLSRGAGTALTTKANVTSRMGSSMEGTIIAYSTSPEMTAADGDGRNSPYTKHLKEFLRRPNTSIDTTLKLTRAEVTKETQGKQTPWYESSINAEFYPAGRGRIEFDDLLRRLIPLKDPNNSHSGGYIIGWYSNNEAADPVRWDGDKLTKQQRLKHKQLTISFDNIFDHFIKRRGEITILMDGAHTHSFKGGAATWDIWLMGPRGGYSEVYLTSNVMGFGGPEISHGFGASKHLEDLRQCHKVDGIDGSRVYLINLAEHIPAWIAEKYTCGASSCSADYMLFFDRSDLKKFGCRSQ